MTQSDLQPGARSRADMWEFMEELFPMYRSLCGPGFHESLKRVARDLPMEIKEYPSGQKAFDWTIPREFKVNESYVLGPDGKRYLDWEDNHYHCWVYSQPFKGVMSREELLEHVATHPILDDAIPMRVTYYQDNWGLCASKHEAEALPPGDYEVNIDTELFDGQLRMGEYYLPGESEKEVLFTSYLCHPHGANDNLSGVAVGVELFKMLARMPKRKLSYRLVVWPETIGAVVWIYNNRHLLDNILGAYVLTCVGDGGPFTYKPSFYGDSLVDRAALHALRHSGMEYNVIPYNPGIGSDERQFNAPGLRLPMGSIMRTMYGEFDEYHTSKDDLEFVSADDLMKSLEVHMAAVRALERARTYRSVSVVEPFMTAHGVYPWRFGAGSGRRGNEFAQAFYHLLGWSDGTCDLIDVADKAGFPVEVFDPAVEDLLKVGLIEQVADQGGKEGA